MLSVHVAPGGDHAHPHCAECPDWHPCCTDEQMAWQMATWHGECVHGWARDADPSQRTVTYDVVVVARLSVLEMSDHVMHAEFAVRTAIDLAKGMTTDARFRNLMGVRRSQLSAFCVKQPDTRLDLNFTMDELVNLAEHWTGDPE